VNSKYCFYIANVKKRKLLHGHSCHEELKILKGEVARCSGRHILFTVFKELSNSSVLLCPLPKAFAEGVAYRSNPKKQRDND